MRAAAFAALLGVMPIVAATTGIAQTSQNLGSWEDTRSQPARPLIIRIPPPARPAAADLPLRLEPYHAEHDDHLDASAVDIGPLRARLGGTAKQAHIARYKLEGMDVLGGSVSGTFDGRGARVYLRWPPSDDDE